MCPNSQVNVLYYYDFFFLELRAVIASSIHQNEADLFSGEKYVRSLTTEGAHFVLNERSGYETLSKGMSSVICLE